MILRKNVDCPQEKCLTVLKPVEHLWGKPEDVSLQMLLRLMESERICKEEWDKLPRYRCTQTLPKKTNFFDKALIIGPEYFSLWEFSVSDFSLTLNFVTMGCWVLYWSAKLQHNSEQKVKVSESSCYISSEAYHNSFIIIQPRRKRCHTPQLIMWRPTNLNNLTKYKVFIQFTLGTLLTHGVTVYPQRRRASGHLFCLAHCTHQKCIQKQWLISVKIRMVLCRAHSPIKAEQSPHKTSLTSTRSIFWCLSAANCTNT